jgi:hypothetical protein
MFTFFVVFQLFSEDIHNRKYEELSKKNKLRFISKTQNTFQKLVSHLFTLKKFRKSTQARY